MDFRILGPLEVEADGQVLPIGSRQPRALLTVLLLDANRVVSRDRLMEPRPGSSLLLPGAESAAVLYRWCV